MAFAMPVLHNRLLVKRCLILFLAFAFPGRGDEGSPSRVIDLGASKAVVFEDTVSPDGNYAIGWTILLKNKSAKPVDWTKWSDDTAVDFVVQYTDPDADPANKDNYQLVDGVLDLKNQKFLPLPTDDPYSPHKNHAGLAAAWSPVGDGKRYVLINNDARFFTTNVWLVAIDPGTWHTKDIVQSLGKGIDPVLRRKRPATFAGYGTNYSVEANGAKSVFTSSTATISFASDIPKSQIDNSEVDGEVTILLPDGKVTGATSDTPVADQK